MPRELKPVARSTLGWLRHLVRGELRGLARFLQSGERVEAMALCAFTWLRGGLAVVTDRRVLLIDKRLLRRARCEELRRETVVATALRRKDNGFFELAIEGPGEPRTVDLFAERQAREVGLALAGDDATIDADRLQARPSAPRPRRRLVSVLVTAALVYAGFAISEMVSGPSLSVRDCVDASAEKVRCSSPAAALRLTRRAGSEFECGIPVVSDRPAVVPWVDDQVFCSTPLPR